MPFVVSKIAQSIDGKTALLNRKSKWITSEESRNDSQLLRAQSCVILTGIGTVLADNPKMNIRANTALQLLSINNQQVRKPLVAICDSELKTPIKAKIIDQNPIIFHASENKTKIINLKKNGATCVYAKDKKTNKVDLEFVLRYLATNNCNQVMLEAGSTLNGAFLEKNLIDEVVLYIAPCILGSGFSSFDISIEKIENKKEFSINNMEKIGKDIKITMAKNS
jgi:diaminohydroxyphosphoribosylaminopyrimidine deaminase/5-amino-6-(5-phosphoribosylamino)uracil reductase